MTVAVIEAGGDGTEFEEQVRQSRSLSHLGSCDLN